MQRDYSLKSSANMYTSEHSWSWILTELGPGVSIKLSRRKHTDRAISHNTEASTLARASCNTAVLSGWFPEAAMAHTHEIGSPEFLLKMFEIGSINLKNGHARVAILLMASRPP